ncbi:putative DNA-binding transcriptional regulator [compost metagenome]
MQLTSKLYSYSKQLSAPTVYEVICNQLLELMNEPESLRKSIAVERYIRDKTHVSRSSVMKILADLKTGGYITIEGGRLIEIRHLPSKY